MKSLTKLKFTRSQIPRRLSQLMQIIQGGCGYEFTVMHAGVEVRPNPRLRDVSQSWGMEHSHDVYHVVLYVEGESSFLFKGRRHKCSPGTLVLASPGETHQFYFCSREPTAYIELCFALEGSKDNLRLPFHELLSLYSGQSLASVENPVALNERQADVLYDLLALLLERLNPGIGISRFSLIRSVFDILAFIIENVYSLAEIHPESANDVALTKARYEIEARYRQHISLTEIAAAANLSVGYFCRAFRSKFKISPMAYKRELRIKAAKNLLLTTDLLSKEIAMRIGFEDVYQFSKAFKRLAGVSPTDYRGKGVSCRQHAVEDLKELIVD